MKEIDQKRDKVFQICKHVLKSDQINEESGLRKTIGWDSLAHVQILIGVEEEFGLVIPADQYGKVQTVKDIFLKLGI